jgi:hypothetical protein
MFVLSVLKSTVEIHPNKLGKDFIATLVERINQQFANFVSFSTNNLYKLQLFSGYPRRWPLHNIL